MTPYERAVQLTTDYRTKLIAGDRPSIIEMVQAAIEDFVVARDQPPLCETHTKYTGKRTPTHLCEFCWELYLFNKRKKRGT